MDHRHPSGGHSGREAEPCGHERGPSTLGRRRLLAGAGAALAAGGAGCLGSDDTTPAPVTLTTADTCDVCGMVVPNHPGPSAEVFYADHRPSDHENPARFDSTWEAFQYDFERQDRGWSRQAFYVTDYSAVEYSLVEQGGDTLVSTHPAAAAFADAGAVTFVVGSDVKGAMGRDLIGFGGLADAESFRETHGGRLASLEEVTRETIAALGPG